MYEGEYLNGKRNGKGKEYYYELKYLNKKEYLKFEGEYLNGLIWNGKGYDYKGSMAFEIIDGIEYRYDDKLIY